MFHCADVLDRAAVFFRPFVHGKLLMHVCRRRHDGRAAGQRGDTAGEVIRAAEVSRQQRDHETPLIVQTDDSGVALLAFDQRRDGAHGDAAGGDEDQRIAGDETLARPLRNGNGQRRHAVPGVFCRCPGFTAQLPGEAKCQRRSVASESDDVERTHLLAARKPCENDAS